MNDMTPLRRDSQLHAQIVTLMRDGYLILPDAAPVEILDLTSAELEASFQAAPFSKGAFYGETTKRFGRILARSSAAQRLVTAPTIIEIVEKVLDGPIQLNLSQAIEIHPGAPVQPPHRDHDMWAFPKERGRTYMINVMWALDTFTVENGATRLWPRSNHGELGLVFPEESDAISAEAHAGSAIIFLGQTLHSGGANNSAHTRRGLIFSYCLEWLLPDENPWLAYPPAVANRFPPELARMVGYRQRFAGLNNFEGREPAILLDGPPEDIPGFEDCMSPEQEQIIRQYYAGIAGEG